ncbi:MAG: hypothetical protein ACK4ME_03975 [Fimbriimonadales bacterium]
MASKETDSAKKPTNQKQLLIVLALFAVLITVGVVQFGGLLFGGEAPPAPANNAHREASGEDASDSQSPSPTGLQLPPLASRDPFRPVLTVAQATPETNKIVRRELSTRPRAEITGNPPNVPPMTLPGGAFGLQPAETPTNPEPETPNYTVTGVVQGPNSVAILADTHGRRRFVQQGDLLEEGWRVVSIERGKITLRKGKQQLTIRVGESTAPNGGNTP